MSSKKKKYNSRFPASRIKKIMQTDEEVGKVAQVVPVIISRALELFVHSLLTKTMQITSAKNAKTLSPSHMKQCILSESRFDFLKDLVKGLPDVSRLDDDVSTPPLTPAAVTDNSVVSVAGLPPTLHSDERVSRELNSLRRTSRASRNSKNDGETLAVSSNVTDESIQMVSPSMATTTASRPQFLLPPSHQLQTQQAPSFQISLAPSFHVGQPNFYTEVNPINLTTSANSATASTMPLTQPTSNFNETANIDEDYDT